MAKFENSLNRTLHEEGGYVKHSKDPGGATNMGVSLRFLKELGPDKGDLDGDGVRTEHIGDLNNDGVADEKDIRIMSKSFAAKIYRKYFWIPLALDNLNNQDLADQIFDIGVNTGSGRTRKILFDSIKSFIGIEFTTLNGAYNYLNRLEYRDMVVINNIVAAKRKQFYESINNKAFIKGWLLRAMKYWIK